MGFFYAFNKEVSTELSLSPRAISFIRHFYLGNNLDREQITSISYSFGQLKKEHGRQKPKGLYQQIYGFCLNASDDEWNLVTMKTKWDLPKNKLQELYKSFEREKKFSPSKTGVNALGF
jgi:hypothetical protein